MTNSANAQYGGRAASTFSFRYLSLHVVVALIVATATVRATPPQPKFRFVHVASPKIDSTDIAASRQRFERVVEKINGTSGVELVIVTGDITASAQPAEFALYKSLVTTLRVPVHTVPGPRDIDDGGGYRAFHHIEPRLDYSFTHNNVCFIGLNNTFWDTQRRRGSRRGRFVGMEWLEQTLAAAGDTHQHIVLFMTVPLSDILAGGHSMADIPTWPNGPTGKAALYSMLEKYRVCMILASDRSFASSPEYYTLHAVAPPMYRGNASYVIWDVFADRLTGQLQRLKGQSASQAATAIHGRLYPPTNHGRAVGASWQAVATMGESAAIAHRSGAEVQYYYDQLRLGALSSNRIHRGSTASWMLNLRADKLTLDPTLKHGRLQQTVIARNDGFLSRWHFTELEAEQTPHTIRYTLPWFHCRGASGRMRDAKTGTWTPIRLERYTSNMIQGFDRLELSTLWGYQLTFDLSQTRHNRVQVTPWLYREDNGNRDGYFMQQFTSDGDGEYDLHLHMTITRTSASPKTSP